MRNHKIVLVGVAAAAAVGLGGSAFTAGNTIADSVAGYGSSEITGATATAVAHTLSADGADITSTLVTFSTDLTAGHEVTAGFGSTALEDCDVDAAANTANCAYATGYDTETATNFVVAVS